MIAIHGYIYIYIYMIQEMLYQMVRHCYNCCSQFYYVMQPVASICDRFDEVIRRDIKSHA